MTSSETRKGFAKARFNEDQTSIVYGEIFIIAVIVGFFLKSWVAFGGALIGLIVVLLIPFLNVILAIGLSAIWGGIGYALGNLFTQNASYVLAGLGFLAGLGVHLAAIEWTQDIASD